MKGDKAAGTAKSRPEWRSCRETNEGRQGGRGSQLSGEKGKGHLEHLEPLCGTSFGNLKTSRGTLIWNLCLNVSKHGIFMWHL